MYTLELTTRTGTETVSADSREHAIATVAHHLKPAVPRGIADKGRYASALAASVLARTDEQGHGYTSAGNASVTVRPVAVEAAPTYTLDALTPDGRHASDYGLTAEEVANARANADRLGITILAVIEETPVDPAALSAFGVQPSYLDGPSRALLTHNFQPDARA